MLGVLVGTLVIASTNDVASRSGSARRYTASEKDLDPNGDDPLGADDITSNAAVRRCFHRLWTKSSRGLLATETAAWIVRKDGVLKCVEWPSTHEPTALTWRGRVPFDLVALAHTHPKTTNPRPSPADLRAAEKLGRPVYTITGYGIWKVSPLTGEFTLVKGREWLERR